MVFTFDLGMKTESDLSIKSYVLKFIMLHGVVLSCLWMKPSCVTIQVKAVEQYVHVTVILQVYYTGFNVKAIIFPSPCFSISITCYSR